MNDPAKEITSVILDLCATDSPDVQKAALEKYFTQDIQFRHPLCFVKAGPNSRKEFIGVFRCYKVLSPHVNVKIDNITYDETQGIMYLDMVEWFRLFFLPIKPIPSPITTRLKLRKVDGLYYISEQEDFFHTNDMAGLILPYLKPIATFGLVMGTLACNVLTAAAETFGVWCPSTANGQANGNSKRD